MRRWLFVAAGTVVLAGAVYFLFFRGGDEAAPPSATRPKPVAMFGSGSSAVAVAGDGTILTRLPAPKEGSLPELPLETPPKGPRLQGPMLEQAEVLGATPKGLRPYVAGSHFGESGVDVDLTFGVELRFGDSTQAARKWRAAAAVLASPSVITLDYVDLHAPSHPSIGGSGHTLPPVP